MHWSQSVMSPGGEASASMEGGGIYERFCTQPLGDDKSFLSCQLSVYSQSLVCAVLSDWWFLWTVDDATCQDFTEDQHGGSSLPAGQRRRVRQGRSATVTEFSRGGAWC